MRRIVYALLASLVASGCPISAFAEGLSGGWQALPLVTDGAVDKAWVQIGYGKFVVEKLADGDAIRTDSDPHGLGLLLYRAQKFGNCQIRVVYKQRDKRSNSGVYVRIDEGILKHLDDTHAPAVRDEQGKMTEAGLEIFQNASEQELGPWYAVHHGFEIQICDIAKEHRSRTAAVYSLAESQSLSPKRPDEWKTMIITLDGTAIRVDVDGEQVTTFDSEDKHLPQERVWFEPKREPKRPTVGYLGLQTHDPGDVVYFKEISVRPLGK
jgi:hypothetical protein